ncbi:TMEM175 family protein [Oceanivirga miroungae]|uniref:Potassium channel n=1 Tax=Oceanivirga miroungae TaxID=1130046 RepID=A0A6I8MEC3_9FUSO|nr:TMEM175 family protein [Oceanivirga miroungae]VWL85567.1 hypothetical protein OMES3154_00853 [Oceanivirga miroungae]
MTTMSRGRMEAFSDGILAIIITVMILKLSPPDELSLNALIAVYPTFLAYVLSYIYIAIYWANHHHLINMVKSVSASLLWRNLFWIFWMSLIPVATEWMGLNPKEKLPTLFYAISLFMCAISYNIVQKEVVKINGEESKVSKNIGKDMKGKISILAYGLAVIFSIFYPIVSYIIFIIIALIWIVPDKRLEKSIKEE